MSKTVEERSEVYNNLLNEMLSYVVECGKSDPDDEEGWLAGLRYHLEEAQILFDDLPQYVASLQASTEVTDI